ncbi:MAG: CerR family C-terminal domain-containing protein [Planctomycetes bacterium]|nr:CerR family C-terminal domain-containing protein [Planctomycetota bacterium]
MFLNRVAVDHEPAWHAQLIMREMLLPTKACAEFVKEYVRPTFGVMQEILGELLPGDFPARRKLLIGFSIAGQILHYRTARPVLTMLLGPETFQSLDVETLTDHITAFSLAAIERFAKQDEVGPANRAGAEEAP